MASFNGFFFAALCAVGLVACVIRHHMPARSRVGYTVLAVAVLTATAVGTYQHLRHDVAEVLGLVVLAGLAGYFTLEILRFVGVLVGEALHGAGTAFGRLVRAIAPWVIGAMVVLMMFKWAPELFESLVALGLMAGVLWFMVRRVGRR